MKNARSVISLVIASFLLLASAAWAGDNKKDDVSQIGNRKVAKRSIISHCPQLRSNGAPDRQSY